MYCQLTQYSGSKRSSGNILTANPFDTSSAEVVSQLPMWPLVLENHCQAQIPGTATHQHPGTVSLVLGAACPSFCAGVKNLLCR
jgi:hypothetical protein